jgi:PLP dependent protein
MLTRGYGTGDNAAGMGIVAENVREVLSTIPGNVEVVAVGKGHTASEIREVIDAGIRIIGENYLQEARAVITEIGSDALWHFTGHVQKNKVKQVVPLFDMIQTLDSFPLAEIVSEQAGRHGKVMPVLVEVNSASEPQKSGVMPEDVRGLIERLGTLEHIRVQGLMTMGPFLDDPEGLRPFFRATRSLFDELVKAGMPGVEMKHLSMGMSDSYLIAIEEGATMVRIGTRIFGPRHYPG